MVKSSVLHLQSLPDQGAEPFRQLLQESLQHLLEGQMTEFVGAVPGERTQARKGYRAGHVTRRLASRAGLLELSVPRDRAKRFSTDLLERYPLQETAFVSALGQMAAEGPTTAKVKALAEALCGHALSAPALGQIQEGLRNALAHHAGRLDFFAAGDGDGGRASLRESRVGPQLAACATEMAPANDPSIDDDPPAAAPQVAAVPAGREAVAEVDCAVPEVPALDVPRHATRARLARWTAGLGGTLVVAGLLLLGMRLMGDAPPESMQAPADFSVTPHHVVRAIHDVDVGRMDPMVPVDPARADVRPAPAVLMRVAAPRPGSHFHLAGVVAADPTDAGGLALIAIDGGLARVVRVGESVDGELALQAVTPDRAMLGPVGGPVTLILELGTPAASPPAVLRAEGGQGSWAAAAATASDAAAAETALPATVLAGHMPPPMTAAAAGASQQTGAEDLVPAAVPAWRSEFQGLSHSERRRLRRLNASR